MQRGHYRSPSLRGQWTPGRAARIMQRMDEPKPRVEIRYCPRCRWLLRAAWYAQELLSTFEAELGEVALVPAEAGVFQIRIGDTLLHDRKQHGGFPDIKALKRMVRDHASPERSLGHLDRGQG